MAQSTISQFNLAKHALHKLQIVLGLDVKLAIQPRILTQQHFHVFHVQIPQSIIMQQGHVNVLPQLLSKIMEHVQHVLS